MPNIFQNNNNLMDTFGEGLQNYYEIVNIKENLSDKDIQTSIQKLMSQRTGELNQEVAPQEVLIEESKAPDLIIK